ncbi:MAG: hypothetical protein ACI8UZ_000248 [Akkermansiaceae bacterium]|jgi:hypothetical protein
MISKSPSAPTSVSIPTTENQPGMFFLFFLFFIPKIRSRIFPTANLTKSDRLLARLLLFPLETWRFANPEKGSRWARRSASGCGRCFCGRSINGVLSRDFVSIRGREGFIFPAHLSAMPGILLLLEDIVVSGRVLPLEMIPDRIRMTRRNLFVFGSFFSLLLA